MRTKGSANCYECHKIRAHSPGAACARHETATSEVRQKLSTDNQRGELGPVLVHAFAYVTGIVPAFDETGRRVA